MHHETEYIGGFLKRQKVLRRIGELSDKEGLLIFAFISNAETFSHSAILAGF